MKKEEKLISLYEKALETEELYLPFFRECRYLYPRYENLFYMARAQIEPLIFHIKSFYEEVDKLEKEAQELHKQIKELEIQRM